ncbi:MAG: M23 family metallopeptidase [Bdellovibrionota bacterium]
MATCRLFGTTFFLVGATFYAQAAVDPSTHIDSPSYITHLADLSGELQSEILSTQKEIDSLLMKLARVELAPEKSPDRLISADNSKIRKKLKDFLSSAIKMKAKQLEHLKKQKTYLTSDYTIAQSLLPLESLGKKPVAGTFKCNFFPLKMEDQNNTFEKLYSYGDYINPSLGKSSAKTQGVWWGNTFGTLVRSCASGEIVFSEYVEGRGYVVGIKHNSRDLTLYGNLDVSSLKSLKTGMKVPEGAPLGFALERFYFEARRGTESVNPEDLIGQDSDVKLGSN